MNESSAGASWRREFVANADAPGAARAWVSEALRDLGAAPEVSRDLALAVSELASNAVRHGPRGTFTVWLDDPPDWWELAVASATLPPDEPDRWTVAAADRPAGRGLGIVRALVDHVTVDRAAGCVRCRVARRG